MRPRVKAEYQEIAGLVVARCEGVRTSLQERVDGFRLVRDALDQAMVLAERELLKFEHEQKAKS